VIMSRSGVRQGDTLSSLLFGIALQPLLREIKQKHPSVDIRAYLDDLTVAGTDTELAAAWDDIEEILLKAGLVLNRAKSKYVAPVPSQALQAVGVAHTLQLQLGDPENPMGLMGATIGTDGPANAELLLKGIKRQDTLFSRLTHGRMPRGVGFDLLRVCVHPRANYIARVHEPEQSKLALQHFDEQVQLTMTHFIGEGYGTEEKLQSTLPLRLGGFALRRMEDVAQIAHQASLEEFHWDEGGRQGKAPVTQHERQEQQDKTTRKAMLEGGSDSVKARIRSSSGSPQWLRISHALICKHWRIASRARLGLPEIIRTTDLICNCRKTIPPRDVVAHVLACKSRTGPGKIWRHDLVAEALRKELVTEHAVTKPSAHFHHDSTATRPDMIIEANRKWVVDVTVAYPLAASHVQGSAKMDACAAKKLEKGKDLKHLEASRRQGGTFMPFAVETFGRWGPRAISLVKEVASSEEHATRIREKVAAAIQYANADMILNQLGYHTFE
jgi:hypothetical protein